VTAAPVAITRLADVVARPRRVALGTFDGVHHGHRAVVRGADTVVTFDPHPLAVVAPDRAPRVLTTVERRAALLGRLGVREVVVIGMDAAFAARPAADFVDDVLVRRLRATHVRVGENFRFGRGAQGDAALLRRDGRFAAHVAPLVRIEGRVVSSTAIRALLEAGAADAAAELLGERFALSATALGPPRPVAWRPWTLGVPVAAPPGHAVPGAGRYSARVRSRTGARAAVLDVAEDGGLRLEMRGADCGALAGGLEIEVGGRVAVAPALPRPPAGPRVARRERRAAAAEAGRGA
jgi:riboflavin kinase / FMN adenylyltransferase